MQRLYVWFARRMPLILTFLTACGCDQVGSVVDDVKSKVTETAQPSTTPSPQAVPATPPQAPLPPTPEQLLAEFNSLKPFEITDAALARVISRPEAASAITELQLFSE